MARDGVEPPTPSLFRPSSTYTYSYLQVCGRLPSTCKYVQGGTTMGWDHGLSEKDEVVRISSPLVSSGDVPQWARMP